MKESTSADRAELDQALESMARVLAQVDPAAPDVAAQLQQRFPFGGSEVERIFSLCQVGIGDGWLVPRRAGPNVRYGRLFKDLHGFAVDAVILSDGSGLGHTHTRGELNLCWALEGAPRFDGNPPGWVVFPPGSHHVPTVTGGAMLFVYFTPGGDVVWDAMPA